MNTVDMLRNAQMLVSLHYVVAKGHDIMLWWLQ